MLCNTLRNISAILGDETVALVRNDSVLSATFAFYQALIIVLSHIQPSKENKLLNIGT